MPRTELITPPSKVGISVFLSPRGLVRETVPELAAGVSSVPAANTKELKEIDRIDISKKIKTLFFIGIFYKLFIFVNYTIF